VILARQLFPQYPEAAIPPALFTVGSMITATLLVQAWVWRDRVREQSRPDQDESDRDTDPKR
jgi:predicted Na+-dependent transporter